MTDRATAKAERATAQAEQRFDSRLAVLDRIVSGHADLFKAELADRASAILAKSADRRALGTGFTVVALAGATGSGKSSLFNALAGTELATTGVRRPTTSIAEAVTFAPGAEELLGWLDINRQHRLDDPALGGLVLIDLPDHDSIVAAHREEMERLAAVTDVFCWVVDPQKYADAALHHEYLERFSGHGAVTLVALNQVDRLDAASRRACSDHLRQLLTADGFSGVRVIETSAVTGEGVSELRRELAARTQERKAAVARLDADLDWVSSDLLVACGDTAPSQVTKQATTALNTSFAQAAGVGAVAHAVAGSHRMQATAAVGWPPTRWLTGLRANPLRRLGLNPTAAPPTIGEATRLRRTSRAEAAPVAQAATRTAVRDAVISVSDGLPEHWRTLLASAVHTDQIGEELDAAVASADLNTTTPKWWRGVGLLQWVLAAVMVVGLGWLAVNAGVVWFGLPALPTVHLGKLGLPTWLALGGAGAGLLLAWIGRLCAGVGATRRAHRATSALTAACGTVADRLVISPLNDELARMSEAQAQCGALARTPH